MPPIICVVGNSGSGKTTLIEKLIPVLKQRGYKVGIIKHASHGFDIDKKGKDSWRHKNAGADTVVVSSSARIAMIKDESEDTLDGLIKYFQDMDIVIAEGYKKENKPKIEIFRKAVHQEMVCRNDNQLIALVTDANLILDVPIFGTEEIDKLSDFIEEKYLSR